MTLKLYRIAVLFCLSILPVQVSASKITVFGVGRLGISIALSLEKAGHEVLGVDLSPEYVAKLNSKTLVSNEPGIEQLLASSRNFKATTSVKEGVEFSDVYFLALSTTTGTDDYYFEPLTALFRDFNSRKIHNKHIVMCCTVFPGYIRETALPELADCSNITLSYCPPFIAQGEIIKGYTEPDMVLIGQGSPEAGDYLESLFQRVCVNEPFLARMSVNSAEIAKLALNSYITHKVAFANLVGDIADETPDADKCAILQAIGQDTRVGNRYLRPGYGYGGPCFPRDNRALGRYADTVNLDPALFLTTDVANEQHAEYMAKKLFVENQSEYRFEDVSYKPGSSVKIIECSQKLNVAKKLAHMGKKVIIEDDEG
ncbi:MAG: UDP-glucose/GDP-mannose dehydrogenase family protein, partial [Gammaproteobacteria bacterium]|nr:UDP-glucose/GDP-mannose dehydrogenase family protein [Gammaproteobacteria bacterium]